MPHYKQTGKKKIRNVQFNLRENTTTMHAKQKNVMTVIFPSHNSWLLHGLVAL